MGNSLLQATTASLWGIFSMIDQRAQLTLGGTNPGKVVPVFLFVFILKKGGYVSPEVSQEAAFLQSLFQFLPGVHVLLGCDLEVSAR